MKLIYYPRDRTLFRPGTHEGGSIYASVHLLLERKYTFCSHCEHNACKKIPNIRWQIHFENNAEINTARYCKVRPRLQKI